MLAAVLMSFTIGGCTVGPDYVRPKAPAAESYKEVQGWKVAEPKDEICRGAWWEIFDDPQLNALEEQVELSNQSIAVAEAQFQQARALVRSARAAYFPQVTAGSSFTRTRRSANLGSSSSGGRSGSSSAADLTSSDFSLPLEASWEPDVWGKVRRTVEASRGNAQASAADLESVRLSIQTELAQNYFQLRTLDAQKRLYDETIAAYERSLQVTKNRYDAAVASKADVLQAQTQLKTTQAQMIELGVQRAQLEHAIALLIGKPASLFTLPVAPLATVPPSIPLGLPSELLERRPDIAAAERRVAAANAQIGAAVAAFYPNITLSASGGFEASHLADWLTWPSRFWSIGASLAGTVFDGGLRRAQTDQVCAAYDAHVASYRNTVLTGFQEVEDNLAALRILEQEAAAQDEAVKSARESVTISINQYKAGTIGYLELVVVQTIAFNNERAAISVLGRRMTAAVLLIKALGGGWTSSELPSADRVGGRTSFY